MAIAKDAHSDAKNMKWCCRTCRSRQRRPPTDYKMFDDATPATRPSSTIYENSCGGDHCDDDDWWWLWWYWWWLVSLETTNFWLLLRDKKMFSSHVLGNIQLVCQFRDDEDDDVNVHPVVFPSLPSPYPIMFLPRIPSPSHSTLPKIKKWLFTAFALYWQNLGSCFPLYFLS